MINCSKWMFLTPKHDDLCVPALCQVTTSGVEKIDWQSFLVDTRWKYVSKMSISTWISCVSQCLCTKTAHTCSANELFPKWRNVGVWSKSLEATADKFQNNDACVLPNGTSHLCNEDLGKVPRQNCFRSCQSLKNMKQNKPLKQLLATTHFSVFLVNGTRNSEAFAKWPSALPSGPWPPAVASRHALPGPIHLPHASRFHGCIWWLQSEPVKLVNSLRRAC